MNRLLLMCGLMAAPAAGFAQTPTLPGQDAYAAIAEVVRILEADRATDWSKVNLESLRQHLVDMNDVTLRSMVKQSSVPGGAKFEVTGEGRSAEAIRRMLLAHAPSLEMLPDYTATAEEIPGGARLTVRAKKAGDGETESRIRGLGFIGLLTVGAHHTVHHLAIARGEGAAHHH
jgi:hypothetical protein